MNDEEKESKEERDQKEKYSRWENGIHSMTEICVKHRFNQYVLSKAIKAGKVPAPSLTIGRRVFFTADEVLAVENFMKQCNHKI